MVEHTFPPEARLHTGREYGRVFYRQQKAGGAHIVVLLAPRSAKGPQSPRLGIMVSTKVTKKAVRRHELKRWVREFFRTEAQHDLGAQDMVVLFHRDPPSDGHAGVVKELRKTLGKALKAEARPGTGKGSKRSRRKRQVSS